VNKNLLPRIVRKETPPLMRGEKGYQRAKEHLRRDFSNRCAYCMIHEDHGQGPEAFAIDHFHPLNCGGKLNEYPNLYWTCIGCNRYKSDRWPTVEQSAHGFRFADPCAEQDYGYHFFEDQNAELVPRTPCGEYHIAQIRLNRRSRVDRRRERNKLIELLRQALESANSVESQDETSLRTLIVGFLQRQLSASIPLYRSNDGFTAE
jgi:hypothetical protein